MSDNWSVNRLLNWADETETFRPKTGIDEISATEMREIAEHIKSLESRLSSCQLELDAAKRERDTVSLVGGKALTELHSTLGRLDEREKQLGAALKDADAQRGLFDASVKATDKACAERDNALRKLESLREIAEIARFAGDAKSAAGVVEIVLQRLRPSVVEKPLLKSDATP